PRLLDEVRRSDAFAEVAESSGDAWRVREEVRYPDPDLAPPAGLALRRTRGTGTDDLIEAPVALTDWPELHDLFSALAGADGLDPAAVPARFTGFVAALADRGFAGPPVEPGPATVRAPADDLSFVGHNTVVV